jgi:competence protein ComEC
MILPNISDRNDNYINLMTMAEDKGVNILFIEEGNWISDGDVHITCLHPASTFRSSSNNSYSTVLRLKYGDFDMLLTGDLEADGERVLLEKLKGVNSMEVQPKAGQPEGKLPVEEVDYDILKVAHHGARSSTSEDLLSIIRPEVAIISCGKNNPYGHPHEELLERLHNNGVEVKVTTKSGAITIRTDGRRMVVEDFR